MTGLGLTLLLALAASASAARGFADDREYVYDHRGIVYTRYSRDRPQYAGYAYYVRCLIQTKGDHLIFKAEKVTKAPFNGEYEDADKADHVFTDLPAHAEFLTRPFRITRKDGIVSQLEVTRDEPTFSVNLKRAVALLFSLKLSTEDDDVQESHANYYKVYEEGMHGDCETTYIVGNSSYDRSSSGLFNVTKVQNLHKCRTRPNQLHSSFRGHKCGDPEHEKPHIVHGSVQHQYSLRGDRDHYIIDQINIESDVTYSPHLLPGETVFTTFKRSFEFVEERPITSPLHMSDDLVSHTSFLYDFDFQRDFRDPVDLKKSHYLYHMPGIKIPTRAIRNMMLDLLSVQFDRRYGRDVEDKNTPAKFVELLKAFSTLAYDEIADVYRSYKAHSDESEIKRYGNLFVDVLASVGTNPAFLFGKHLIETQKLSVMESQHLMQQLPLHLKEVSQVLMDHFQELCEVEYVKQRPELHIQCVTSFSNVVFDHCVAPHQPEGILQTGKNACPYDAALNYFNYIARLHEKTDREDLRMAYAKAAGNTGVREALALLRPYVEGLAGHHLLQRDSAIWALENVGEKHPEEVRNMLFPLFFNRSENYVLRLDAFTQLLRLSPELYEIEGVARSLKDDPDDQVKSYVYSTFKTLANATHVCVRQLSRDARFALRILEDVEDEFERYDYSYSKAGLFDFYNRDYKKGGFNHFSYFASDTGYVPRKMYLKLEDFTAGKYTHGVGLGINQVGLEKFLDRILGPSSAPKKQSSKAQMELDDIKTKLNLPVRDYEPLRGEIYFKHRGDHHSSYYFDERVLESLFETGRSWLSNTPLDISLKQFYCQRFVLTEDHFHVLPTEIGIPLLLDYKQPVHFYYSNYDSSFKVEREEGNHHMKASLNGHLVIDHNMITYMAVDVAYDLVDVGAGINRRSTLSMPLKLELDLATKEKRMELKWTPVAPHDVYHFQYEPFTFIDSYINVVPKVLEPGYSPVRKVRHQMQQNIVHDVLGVGFDVKAEHENQFKQSGSWLDFLLERDSRQAFYYLQAHSEPCNVHVQLSNRKPNSTVAVDVDLSYHHHDDNWIIPHFPEENFEDYDRQKEDRGPLYTCVLKADVRTYGNTERKIHAVTTWTRDLLRTFHKLDFFYEKSLTESNGTETTKVCASSYLKYPRYDLQKFAMLDTLDLEHAVHSGMKVHFGENCHSDQKIEVSGLFTDTEEQKEFEKRREDPDTPEHYNEYSRWYHQCQEERQRGIHYAEGCMKYRDIATTLHKYTFHIKSDNLSPAFLNRTYHLDRILKYALLTHSEHNEIDVHNPVNEVHIEANFSSKLPVADIRALKPTSNSNYYNIYFPRYVGFKSYPMFEDTHVKKSYSDLYCGLEGDEVFTFDRFNYTLPSTDCYKVVVAKDCSPKELFTVLATKTKHPRYHKAVRVFLGNHKIEVLPEASEVIVRVDGKRVPVARNEPYLHKEGDEIIFYVTFRGSHYALHSEKYGLIVEYDADAVFVQVSPYYRGKLCGLCGNYNGQKHDGSITSEGCYYKDEKSYAYAYTVPSEACSVPRPELICENPLLKNDLAEITRMEV